MNIRGVRILPHKDDRLLVLNNRQQLLINKPRVLSPLTIRVATKKPKVVLLSTAFNINLGRDCLPSSILGAHTSPFSSFSDSTMPTLPGSTMGRRLGLYMLVG